MLKTYAHDFVSIVQDLHNLRLRVLVGIEETDFQSELERLRAALVKIKEYSSTFGLKAALGRIRDIEKKLAKPEETPLDDLMADVKELQRDIVEALEGEQFLYVPQNKAPYWENEEFFGEDVILKIDNARRDIREACSCFAVGRFTATVYHCIGIMQAALFKLASKMSAEDIDLDVDDWGSVIGKIERAMKALETQAKASHDSNRWSEWKGLEPRYNEIISDANAVKKAWRHRSAHFRDYYEASDAEKVLSKVGDFVKDVARLLP